MSEINHSTALDDARAELRSMIADSITKLFSDHITPEMLQFCMDGETPVELWKLIEANGLDAAAGADEESPSFADVYSLFHATGYWQAPLPLLETVVANYFLAQAKIPLPGGMGSIATHNQVSSLEFSLSGKAWNVKGVVEQVPWGRSAQWLLLPVSRDRAVALCRLEGYQALVEKHVNIANEPRDNLIFEKHHGIAAALPGNIAHPHTLLVHLALAKSIAIVGALECSMDRTLTYVSERVQFGRPLTKFQVIQHALAEMAGLITAARMATRVAAESAERLSANPDAWQQFCFDTAVAKVRASEAATRSMWVVHQLHGAIGFTQEYPLQFATKRLLSWRSEYGSDTWWARRLGHAAIKLGAKGFWPALTDRSLGMDL